jgi:hypothetical protein
MRTANRREWNHEKLLSTFTGLLVLIGIVYSIATILQWRSMNQQARTMTQQLEIMKAEMNRTEAARAADLLLRFDERLSKEPYAKLASAIDSHKHFLKENGGKFTDDDLEGYLNILDGMNDLYQRHLIPAELFYNGYSYQIEKASDNLEIQNYLKQIRKDDPDLYSGFDHLAKEMKALPHTNTLSP